LTRADLNRAFRADAAVRYSPCRERDPGLDQLITAALRITVRNPSAKRGLGAIAAAVVVSLAAQQAALNRHGPVANTRGPDDGDWREGCALALTGMLRAIEATAIKRERGATVNTRPGRWSLIGYGHQIITFINSLPNPPHGIKQRFANNGPLGQ
jgi:hypothetical protein